MNADIFGFLFGLVLVLIWVLFELPTLLVLGFPKNIKEDIPIFKQIRAASLLNFIDDDILDIESGYVSKSCSSWLNKYYVSFNGKNIRVLRFTKLEKAIDAKFKELTSSSK